MKELKTLKDFEKEELYKEDLVRTALDELKQEAIKIIKLSEDHYEFIKQFPFKILNDRERTVIREFVKWQNNITDEEDLK